MNNLLDKICFWFHRNRLMRKVAIKSKAYQQYLDTQFHRTWSMKSNPPPLHTKILVDKVAEFIELTRCDVLCVGCRNTAEIKYFQDKGAKSVVGIDLFSESPDILVMDMHAMTFPGNRFDIVYSAHSLEHASNHKKVVSEITRVARPNALVAIEVPVKYEVRGADLMDFGNLQTLCTLFDPHIAQMIWSVEQPPNSPSNDNGTAIVRAVFLINKATEMEAMGTQNE